MDQSLKQAMIPFSFKGHINTQWHREQVSANHVSQLARDYFVFKTSISASDAIRKAASIHSEVPYHFIHH